MSVICLVLLLEHEPPKEVDLAVVKGSELIHLQEKKKEVSTSKTSAINGATHKHVVDIEITVEDKAHSEATAKLITETAIKDKSVHVQQNVPRPNKNVSKALYTVRAVVDYQGSKSKMSFSTGDEIAVYDNTTYIKYHLGKLIKSELHPLSGKKLFFRPQDVVKIEKNINRRRASVKPSSFSSNTSIGKKYNNDRRSSVI